MAGRDPKLTEKLVRRTLMVGSLTGAFFLLTGDISIDSIKMGMKSVENSVKNFISGSDHHHHHDGVEETDGEKPKNNN